MKLKKLTIHNIASIEDAVIDFENGPLAEDSLFLICGPTGAGKSTLLDAICLALYGTTPRLEAATKAEYSDDAERFGTGETGGNVKVDDPRMLMRRGSLDAKVELVFTDKDDQLLKSVWICRRFHHKRSGRVMEAEWCLYDAQEVPLTEKVSITKLEIAKRIGMSFEQFCRTTMLAQGDFTKFLKSDDKHKAEILEKLTGTEIYSRLGKRIFEVKNEKEAVCKQIRSKMEGVQLLTDEMKIEVNAQLASAEEQKKQWDVQEKEWKGMADWLKLERQLADEQVQANKAVEDQLVSMKEPAFVSGIQLLEDYERTAEARGLWKTRQEAKALQVAKQKDLDGMKETYVRLCGGLLAMNEKVTELHMQEGKMKEFLQGQSARVESYQQVTLIEQLVKQWLQQTKVAKDTEAAKVKKVESQDRGKKKLEEQQNEVQKLLKEEQAKQQAWEAADKEYQVMNVDKLDKDMDGVNSEVEAMKTYKALLEKYEEQQQALGQKQKHRKEAEELLTKNRLDLSAQEKMVEALKTKVEEVSKLYEKQELACKDFVKEVRAQLAVGDTCPVCGQPVHHLPADGDFESMLQPVKEMLEAAKKEQKGAETKLAELKASVNSGEREVTKCAKEEKESAEQLQKLTDKKQALPLDEVYGQLEDAMLQLEGALKQKQEDQQALKQKQEVARKQQKLVVELRNTRDDWANKRKAAQDEVKDITTKLSVLATKIEGDEKAIRDCMDRTAEAKEKLVKLMDWPVFELQGMVYVEELKAAAGKYDTTKKELEDIKNELATLNEQQKQLVAYRASVDEVQPVWKEQVVVAPQKMEKLSEAWQALQAEVKQNQGGVEQAVLQVAQAQKALDAYFASQQAVDEVRLQQLVAFSVEEISALQEKHRKVQEDLVRLQANKDAVADRWKQLQEQRPELKDADGDSSDSIVSIDSANEEVLTLEVAQQRLEEIKQQLEGCNQQLGQWKQQLATDEENRKRFAVIGKELEKAEAEATRWGNLHNVFGCKDGSRFRNIAQSFVLQQLLLNANQYLQQFTDRYELECQPASLTILLRDKEAGGVLRPVTTISGGESFLISLSLALGLSSLSRASISMDMVFIDEGFGTLDGTYLSCVMDSLERLHQMGGKRIGIISHVESLRERITTQIQVSRVNTTLSKVQVVSTL